MTEKFSSDVFAVPKPDPATQLMGITADVASLHSSITMQNTQLSLQNENVNRRLSGIEAAINKIENLTEAVMAVQGQLSSHTRAIDAMGQWRMIVDAKLDSMADHNSRLRECEVRCETINHNGEIISTHELRLARIESMRDSFFSSLKASAFWLLGIFATFIVAIIATKLHIDISTIEHISSIIR